MNFFNTEYAEYKEKRNIGTFVFSVFPCIPRYTATGGSDSLQPRATALQFMASVIQVPEFLTDLSIKT